MDRKLFTIEDCNKDSHYNEVYEGKIIVMRPEALKKQYRNIHYQLWLGNSGFGCDPSLTGRAVFATCLLDEEYSEWRRENFLGTIKPEVLPDWARLKLSQIKPPSDVKKEQMPQYKGYSFLKNGRYIAGIDLYNKMEVMAYVELQKPYQHRIVICDRDDANVLEIMKGKIIHPCSDDIKAYLSKEEQSVNAMKMDM